MKMLIVGSRGATHIGGSLERAALELGLNVNLLDLQLAMQAPRLIQKFNWHLRGHRPARLKDFNKEAVTMTKALKSDLLLSVGLIPIEDHVLAECGRLKIRRIIYLTDDPWNKAHYSHRFIKALPYYDHVFTPRKSVIDDLDNIGCKNISYLPFGYDPAIFYPEKASNAGERSNFNFDIVFAGSADKNRVPYVHALLEAGFNLGLYGSFWKRFGNVGKSSRGQADVRTLRLAIGHSKIALCLVRRSNRDGHCMRTFEIPAIGTCMLTEDTPEHRQIFGSDEETVAYFKNTDELIQKAGFLIANESERNRLAEKCHNLIVGGGNTYKDRLLTMLKSVNI
jgi:spore maturation protein CgeB